ncbi:hypothetical protein TSUD_260060 [Trifolium subterraneum]|uniref:Uncharacterized protein n=1 Tax=Trifolium subterraneum TaxID=3900 RepID=A0A2Z6MJZ4_TRISU|nr:hypothetical protein TSUD_260060 [Trifolium subterraneum]
MGSRPEVVAPPEIFYGNDTSRKYTSCACYDIALELEVEGDLLLGDMGQVQNTDLMSKTIKEFY